MRDLHAEARETIPGDAGLETGCGCDAHDGDASAPVAPGPPTLTVTMMGPRAGLELERLEGSASMGHGPGPKT